jgi:hypothetical protein
VADIVDDLEIIDVYVQEGKLVLLEHGPLGLILELVPEGDLIVQAGKGVPRRETFRLFCIFGQRPDEDDRAYGREW